MLRLLLCFVWLLVVCGVMLSGQHTAAEESRVDFSTQVRPILEQHCVRCHGAKLQESNFRLDLRESAMGMADFGVTTIVPGDAQKSPLWRFVAGQDPDGTVMPPEDEEKRPSQDELQVLRSWIDQGATWPDEFAGESERLSTDHWSFQPLRRARVPQTADPWIRNPLDAFILTRLEQNGLDPSPRADRRKLIRRVYLIMHGLPPAPWEVQSFVDDHAPDAYEQMIDRVLSSPRYGERWARHWLDVVRFAETNGFETNRERPNAFPYRDYVIRSLNEDKPYDRFVKEQICGDALGVDAATGFLVAGPYDLVKSPDVSLTLMQRQDELADIVNTTGTAFLGLTLGCARCHNHKFDPILQKDYFSLQAIFAGVNHGERPLRSAATAAAEAKLARLQVDLADKQARFNAFVELGKRAYQAAAALDQQRPSVSTRLNEDAFEAVEAHAVRFSVRATNTGGEPCIDELEVYDSNDVNVALASRGTTARSSGNLSGYEIHKLEHINDGKVGNTRSWISDTPGKGWVELSFPNPVPVVKVVWGRDRDENFRDRLAIDYVVEVAVQPDEWRRVSDSRDRKTYAGERSVDALLESLPTQQAECAKRLAAEIQTVEQRIGSLTGSMSSAWIGTFQQPAVTHRLHRGDPLAKREPVPPDTLSVLGSLGLSMDESEQMRRVRFAEWAVSPESPLTPRVVVNRLWHYHFGTGIVGTPSDFGAAGAAPTHPLLLDWLASELVDQQWSLKHIHRLILNSATFAQDSRPRDQALNIDAAARLLWRFPPRRMEAEAMRDSILQVTGNLNSQIGGPGFSVFKVSLENVRHYFPKETWGSGEWRRMVYMTKVRQEQDAVFGSFDCPDGNQVVPKRSRSTTPLQALNLFNSSFMLQQSQLFADRLLRESGSDRPRQVSRGFELVTGRPPDPVELAMSRRFVAEYGLEAFCRALLNGNEFLFVF